MKTDCLVEFAHTSWMGLPGSNLLCCICPCSWQTIPFSHQTELERP